MPRLPNITDLGPTPTADPGRAVASYDVSGIARGAEALTQAGQRFGAGVQQAGEGAAEYELDKARWQYSAAKQGQAADLLAAHASLQGDNVYGPDDGGQTMQDRYADRAAQINDKWSQTIENPQMRQRFGNETVPQVQQLNDAALTRARSLGLNASVASVKQNGDSIIDTANSTVLDDGVKASAIDAHSEAIDGLVSLGAYTPEQALAEKRGFAQKFAMANGVALADNGAPEQVKRDLGRTPGSPDAIADQFIKNESGGNPLARSTTSNAFGAGQFEPATWISLIKANRPDLAQGHSDAELLDMRADPNLSRDMIKVNNAQNSAYLKAKGLDATPGAQYLAYVLGPASAAAVLQADPKAPVADVLSKAVGDDQAKKMIAANPSILGGQLAGSVAQWADTKMGAASQGHPYDMLDTAQHEELWRHADTVEQKQKTGERADFQLRVNNDVAEATDAGQPSRPPLTRADFIAEYGANDGPVKFGEYDTGLQTGRAAAGLATMSPEERHAAIESVRPQLGDPLYSLKDKGLGVLQQANARLENQAKQDPATFAISTQPASKEAWANFGDTLRNPQASADDRAQAAQAFAARTKIDQDHFGIDEQSQRIVPKGYAENLALALKNPAGAGGSANVLNRIASESKMWGDYWPQVYRESAPKLDPTLRVLGTSHVDPAAAKAMIDNYNNNEEKILGTQYDVKKDVLGRAVTDAFAPYAKTMLSDDARQDNQGFANKLAAIYLSRGGAFAGDATKAATQAVKDTIGGAYDLQGTYRVPHDSGFSGAQIAAGVAAARADPDKLDIAPEGDNVGGLSPDYLQHATASGLARNGTWVTDPHEHGLMLVDKDKFVRSRSDPSKPFSLSWSQLEQLGRGAPATRDTSADMVPTL